MSRKEKKSEQKTIVCKQCKKRIKEEVTCCPHCNALLSETVSLGDLDQVDRLQKAKKKKKKKLTRSELWLRIALVSVSVLAVLVILAGILIPLAPGWMAKWMDKKRPTGDNKFSDQEQSELGVNTALPTKDILNIALFGLDERGETGETVDGLGNGKAFHSDAIIILTVDRRDPENPRVKMSSIARDTLVYVEGYSSKGSLTKITNAFDYGYRKAKRADTERKLTEADYKREGAKTAIKTLNQNFNMNITEYMYVNFVEFMDIIDYMGGVTINVQQKELNELNKHVKWMEIECDRDIDRVEHAGEQTLSGGQALAYARVRKIDSDLVRTNRQRDVLKAVFEKVKNSPLTKLPDIVGQMLSLCHTTLSSEEIVELGTWAVTNSPEIINYTLPDTGTELGYKWIWEGTHPDYNWVWIYDLNYATHLLHDFIYDTDTAKDQPKPTLSSEPKATRNTTTTTGAVTPGTTSSFTEDPADTTTDSSDTTGWPTDSTEFPIDPTGSGDSTTPSDPTDTDVIGTVDPTGSTETGDVSDTTTARPTGPNLPTPPTSTESTENTDTTTPSLDTSDTTTTTTIFVMP